MVSVLEHEQTETVENVGPWNQAWECHPASLEELWGLIGKLALAFGPNTKFVWRGMSSAEYQIKSSLFRMLESQGIEPTEHNHRENELETLRRARDWGLGHSEFGYASDLHLLALLQHHGYPTRLVDVTQNPLTALWFACESRPEEPGRLVAFSVPNTPILETSPPEYRPTYGLMQDPNGWGLSHALQQSAESGQPFLVSPIIRDARMTAQEGLFITAAVPQESQATPFPGIPYPRSEALLALRLQLEEIGFVEGDGGSWPHFGVLGMTISQQMKRDLLPILTNTFNRSHRTIYPDIAGFVGTPGEWRDYRS